MYNTGLLPPNNIYLFPWYNFWGYGTSNGHAMDSPGTNHYVGMVFCSPVTVTVSKIYVYIYWNNSFSGTSRLSVQGVNSSGNPDGTIKESGNAYGNPTVADGWISASLGTSTTLTRGSWYSIVYDITAYTSGAVYPAFNALNMLMPPYQLYGVTDLGAGSWTKTVNMPTFILEDSDGKLVPNIGQARNHIFSLTTTSNPDEMGNLIYMPFPARAIGLWAWFENDNGMDLKLYSDTTAIRTVSLDSNYRGGTGSGCMLQYFAEPVMLQVGVPYRAVMTATSTTAQSARYFIYPSASGRGQYLEFGDRCVYTSRVDSGTFSETDTRTMVCGIACDMIPDGRRFSSNLRVYT